MISCLPWKTLAWMLVFLQFSCRAVPEAVQPQPLPSVMIECRVFEIGKDMAWPEALAEVKDAPAFSVLVSEDEMVQIITNSQHSKDTISTSLPRMNLEHLQPAEVIRERQHGYVVGYKEKAAPAGSDFVPQVEVASDGVRMNVTAGIYNEGKLVDLECALTINHFHGVDEWPYATLTPQPTPLKIQTPKTSSWTASTRQHVPRGHALVLGGVCERFGKPVLITIYPVIAGEQKLPAPNN